MKLVRRTFQAAGKTCAKVLWHEGVWLRRVKKPEACGKSNGGSAWRRSQEETEGAGPGSWGSLPRPSQCCGLSRCRRPRGGLPGRAQGYPDLVWASQKCAVCPVGLFGPQDAQLLVGVGQDVSSSMDGEGGEGKRRKRGREEGERREGRGRPCRVAVTTRRRLHHGAPPVGSFCSFPDGNTTSASGDVPVLAPGQGNLLQVGLI